MRILIAVHGFPPTYYAGAERAAERLVHWLVANDHEVEVFTVEKLDSPTTFLDTQPEDGFTIHRLHYDINQLGTLRNMYEHPAIAEAFQQVIDHQHFDLVHIISGYLLGGQVIQIAKRAGIPVALTLTEYWFMCARLHLLRPAGDLCSGPESDKKCARCLFEEKRRYRLPAQLTPQLSDLFWSLNQNSAFLTSKAQEVAYRRQTLREALEMVDLVISPSRFLIEKFKEFGYNTNQYAYIRHGLTILGSPGKREARAANGTLRLGYLGQIKAHKGTDLLINAVLPLLKKGASVSVDIWGPETEEPSYAENLRQATAAYPAISWRGQYDAPEVWNILSGFDALVVPSRWYENSPTVIAEAFTMGLPVVATNLGGMAELVEHEKSGLLFELNNANDLRQQICRLLQDRELLSRLRAGIPRVTTAEDEAAAIFQQYQKLVRETL